MKVLFADVDGVLNHWALYAEREGRTDLGDETEYIDVACVARLQRIVAATGAELVLSSTWRLVMGLRETEAILRAHGLRASLFDATPDLVNLVMMRECRGAEIASWLDHHHDVEQWVVIDDDVVDVDPTRFVRTNIAVGLTDEDADRAIAILGRAR